MTPLTVVCVWVKGPVPYTADYVVRLERMVRKYLQRPFRFVCLTDQPKALPKSIERVIVPTPGDDIPPATKGIWTKLEVFNPDRQWQQQPGRVLYLDLDVLVVANLDPIVDFPASFALTEDAFVVERAHLNVDRYGRRLVRRFNSSVMVWDGGTQTELFADWSVHDALRLSTDQDWIGEQSDIAKPMPLGWFPRISRVQPPWPAEAKVVLVKKPKNHEAAERWAWFEQMWGAA